MQTFLYVFGYESPRQLRDNSPHGWDDEDSEGVLISAQAESDAYEWGRQIAEAFLVELFQDESVSWRERGYADGMEKPVVSWPGQQHVRVGELPDFAAWLEPYQQDT